MPASGALPSEKTLEQLRPLRLRYLAPREIANLHGFPAAFDFPPTVGRKKQMELLGNSLSVQVVAELLQYLLAPQSQTEEDAHDRPARHLGLETAIPAVETNDRAGMCAA